MQNDRKIKQALTQIQQRDYAPAAALLRTILNQAPSHADALQLYGLAVKGLGRLEEAREAMSASLAVRPRQPNVLNNLGGVHLRLNDPHSARLCFEQALRLDKGYKEAWRNLAIAHRRSGDLDQAESAARAALVIDPGFAPGLDLLGQIQLDRGETDSAVQLLESASKLSPGSASPWLSLGAALRSANRLADAREALETALRLAPHSALGHAMLGAVCYDLAQAQPAMEAFQRALEIDPTLEDAHFALNQILWRTGESDSLLASYVAGESARPDAVNVYCGHAQTLMLMDRSGDAEAVIRNAAQRAPDNLRVMHLLGRILTKSGKAGEAVTVLERVVAAAPGRPDARTAFARALMVLGDFKAALTQLDSCDSEVAYASELEQEILALTFVCARQLDPARAAYLYDYEKFVRAREIATPVGFASLQQFNDALAERLNQMHTEQREPIEQTLRGGTQTNGRLFDNTDPLIQALKGACAAVIARYLDELPHLPDHPFGRRRPSECRFAGSWSVRLRDGGYHKNHFHSRGWLSSAYYVALPDVIGAENEQKAGWLKFGQPNELPGAESPPEHWIRPKVGLLALFPSYMWHGTEQFSSREPRLTVAFDTQSSAPTPRQLGRL